MIALLYDMAISHYQNHIGLTDGRQTVGYDKAGSAFHHGGKCFLDADLGSGIDGGGCLIQDQHWRQCTEAVSDPGTSCRRPR